MKKDKLFNGTALLRRVLFNFGMQFLTGLAENSNR